MAAKRRLGLVLVLVLLTASLAGCIQVQTTQDPSPTGPSSSQEDNNQPDAAPNAQARAKVEGDWVAANGDSFEVQTNRTFLLDASNSTGSDGSLNAIHWELGDGSTHDQPRISHRYAATGVYWINLTVEDHDGNQDQARLTARVVEDHTENDPLDADNATPSPDPDPSHTAPSPPQTYQPHVLVGIPDTGINPYHEIYYRPNLTQHPCTYLQDFPCDIQKLPLTVGTDDYQEAFEQDQHLWDNVEQGRWYWIPQTAFVAVHCEAPYAPSDGDTCILDDSHMHGTGTTSTVLMENPEALLAFSESQGNLGPFETKNLPVDVYSVSWGNIAPIPGHPSIFCANYEDAPLYVTAAGNDPRSTLIDCTKGAPGILSVGGAYAQDDSEEPLAAKQPEIVSYYCRPTAQTQAVSEMRESYCGTSFAAPTAAGALSKVVLEIRQDSGYTGTIQDGMIDPTAGLSIPDLRTAMNQTASYNPEPQYDNTRTSIPRSTQAPWIQWGWGFYDGLVAEQTTQYLLGPDKGTQLKSDEAQTYMDALHTAKQTLYGDP